MHSFSPFPFHLHVWNNHHIASYSCQCRETVLHGCLKFLHAFWTKVLAASVLDYFFMDTGIGSQFWLTVGFLANSWNVCDCYSLCLHMASSHSWREPLHSTGGWSLAVRLSRWWFPPSVCLKQTPQEARVETVRLQWPNLGHPRTLEVYSLMLIKQMIKTILDIQKRELVLTS